MIRRKLFENFAYPRGLWGRLADRSWPARRPTSSAASGPSRSWTSGPTTVLELGYGPGLSLAEACRRSIAAGSSAD